MHAPNMAAHDPNLLSGGGMIRARLNAAEAWQMPALVVMCGCLIAVLTFGPRTAMGLLLPPMSRDTGWTRDVFALAIALQHIIWGVTQPFGGAFADRLGSGRALCAGSLVYASGLFIMANAASPAVLYLGGALLGLGLSGASYNIVLAAFGKLLQEQQRPLAVGIGGAAGSVGQFLFAPLCVLLLEISSWRATLVVFGALVLMVIPLSVPLATSAPRHHAEKNVAPNLPLRQLFREALHRGGYLLLIAGYLVSGFFVAFVNFHLPAYLQDEGLDRPSAGWVIATIGVFNIIGSVGVGWLCTRFRNRDILFSIYLLRALLIGLFLVVPLSGMSAFLFAAGTGSLWMSAVTPVAGLITVTFGTRNLAALYGLAYLSHQVGAFCGVWLGGLVFNDTGSYTTVWWSVALATALMAAVTLLIREAGPPRPRGILLRY
jgi:predicted MFS family arabinose efflux permease